MTIRHCTRDMGHSGPCDGFSRPCEDNRPCWALRSLSGPPETHTSEVIKMWDRCITLEAENVRLRTRINELISLTANYTEGMS